MAHRLSSSLYDEGNKMSKGQEMYLKRAKKAGKWVHGQQQQHQQQQQQQQQQLQGTFTAFTNSTG